MADHYLTAGERIAERLAARLPDARICLALSLPLAARDSLRSGQDGIYVIYRGADVPDLAARLTHAHIPQRWGVVILVRWLSEAADNPALWEKAGDWALRSIQALAGWDHDMELVALPAAVAADPENATVAALEIVWRKGFWLQSPTNFISE